MKVGEFCCRDVHDGPAHVYTCGQNRAMLDMWDWVKMIKEKSPLVPDCACCFPEWKGKDGTRIVVSYNCSEEDYEVKVKPPTR